MLEKDIERRCCEYAATHGVPNDKFVVPGKRGASDRIFWGPEGRALICEFKRPGGRVSRHQELFASKLTRLGYFVATCFSYEEFVTIFDIYTDAEKARKWLQKNTPHF